MGELSNRREKLFDLMDENSVAIYFAGVSKYASEDEAYPFKANNNFFYLTGISQENSALVLIKTITERKTYLFIDEYDEVKEKWTGKRLTNAQAINISEIKNVYTTNSFDNTVELALTNINNQYGPISKCYTDLTSELKLKDEYSVKNFALEMKEKFPHITFENGRPFVCDLRMKKSSYEIECILHAINNTNSGILTTLSKMKPGMIEKEIADIFEFYGRKIGSRDLAFSTICAWGKNATCLHYPQQGDKVGDSGLVLFDLGYSYNGYSADISRTYPINGKFSSLEKDIYESVLACNKACIDHVEAGMTIKELQEFARSVLKEECVKRKLMTEDEDISKYYYHNVSHHLGLDTHDISVRERPLEDGNIITVEPGLYFAKYGIGVRIEDDVLISKGRGECLSKCVLKEVSDIEKLFNSRR